MVDQTEDAYALSFEDNSLANIILFDVWHHLEYPGSALTEFARILESRGRLILFEPAALSLLGWLVYGLFHHEPIGTAPPVTRQMPEGQDPKSLPYYAAQGNAWRMFSDRILPGSLNKDWAIIEVKYYPAFDWLLAGGFRKQQLTPTFMSGTLQLLSKMLAPLPSIFATRMLVVLELK
jgi:SAM-dependent methyltransferase